MNLTFCGTSSHHQPQLCQWHLISQQFKRYDDRAMMSHSCETLASGLHSHILHRVKSNASTFRGTLSCNFKLFPKVRTRLRILRKVPVMDSMEKWELLLTKLPCPKWNYICGSKREQWRPLARAERFEMCDTAAYTCGQFSFWKEGLGYRVGSLQKAGLSRA